MQSGRLQHAAPLLNEMQRVMNAQLRRSHLSRKAGTLSSTQPTQHARRGTVTACGTVAQRDATEGLNDQLRCRHVGM
eukprot:11304974-Karenia_brevis.AAC.1